MNGHAFLPGCVLLLAGCGGSGGGDSAPLSPQGQPAEIVLCRARADSPHNATDIRTLSQRGLGDRKVLDRSGIETGVRVHPDGNRIVFARERLLGDEQSRELFVATLDGSSPELRLTADRFADDRPCWSPDGRRILFSSDRLGTGRRLWLVNPDGSGLEPLLDDGAEQLDADWTAAGDRIVFARIDRSEPRPRARLWLLDSGSRAPRPLTDGGPAGTPPAGDYEPAFSPDGATVVASRIVAARTSMLIAVDVATGAATELSPPLGEDRFPRFSPRGDRILVARSRPADGMPGLRLWLVDPDGTNALLLLPDKRFDYLGFDPLPRMAARAARSEPTDVPLDRAALDVVVGRLSRGAPESILAPDQRVLGIATQLFDGRDIAGIELRATLPADRAEDVLELEVEVLAALTTLDREPVLRLSIDNFVAGRSDTVVEATPSDTDLRRYGFVLQSLAHVDRDKRITLQVIGDFARDVRAELLIDHVRIRVRRAGS